jgi:hypothetical protein
VEKKGDRRGVNSQNSNLGVVKGVRRSAADSGGDLRWGASQRKVPMCGLSNLRGSGEKVDTVPWSLATETSHPAPSTAGPSIRSLCTPVSFLSREGFAYPTRLQRSHPHPPTQRLQQRSAVAPSAGPQRAVAQPSSATLPAPDCSDAGSRLNRRSDPTGLNLLSGPPRALSALMV